MRTTLIRLGFAAFLTLLGLLVTFEFSRRYDPGELASQERAPIGHAFEVDGVHYVRHEGSKFSTPLQEGEPIFPGDTVKTSDHGGMKVRFPAGDKLELEADTTVIFTFSGDHVVLNLMDGYVNVAGTAGESTTETTLQISKGGKTEKLLKGAQLSTDSANGVQVSQGAKVAVQTALNIKWASPEGEINHLLNAEDPEPIEFKWSGGTATQKIVVEWGSSRKKMTNHADVRAEIGSLKKVLPIGRHFWRWAVYEDGKEEPIFVSPSAPALVKGVYPPAVIGPTAGATVLLKNLNEVVTFKWTNDEHFDEYKLEVARDSSFKEILKTESLKDTGVYEFHPPKFEHYFWRLSGRDVKAGWLKGKTHDFIVKTRELEKAKLRWVTKVDLPLRYGTEPSATLAWAAEPMRLVKQFRIRVASTNEDLSDAKPVISETPEVTVKLDGPGKYQAQVEALNSETDSVGQTSLLIFELKQVDRLRAPAMVTPLEEPIRADSKGHADIAWEQLDGAKQYNVDIKDPAGAEHVHNSKTNNLNLSKLLPGEYEVRLSAVDSYGRPGQKSEAYRLIVPNKNGIKLKVKKVEVQ